MNALSSALSLEIKERVKRFIALVSLAEQAYSRFVDRTPNPHMELITTMITKPNHVLVVDANKKPLTPCKPSMAKKLLKAKKAAVYRRFPFTIILKKECLPNKQKLELKIDPGSKTTGLSLILNNALIWCGELNHRGSLIKKKLESRRASRRLRRSRLRRTKTTIFKSNSTEKLASSQSDAQSVNYYDLGE